MKQQQIRRPELELKLLFTTPHLYCGVSHGPRPDLVPVLLRRTFIF